MDISVIEELKTFEEKQKASLEERKKQFLNKLQEQKKELLERNEREAYGLSSGKQEVLKKAAENAKEEAVSTIKAFDKKTDKMKKLASEKVDAAVDIIFKEFLRQNV